MPQIHSKESFDRFGDDLSEDLLSYIPFEDSFHFRGVSKQWKQLILNKTKFLYLNISRRKKLKINLIITEENKFNLKKIELIIKNCPNITAINLNTKNCFIDDIINVNEVFEMIIENCKNLSEISFDFSTIDKSLSPLTPNIVQRFCQKFGSKLKKIHFCYDYCKSNDFLKLCPNVKNLKLFKLSDVFDGNEVLCKKLKSISFWYLSKDLKRIETLIESNKNSLEVINIEVLVKLNGNNLSLLFNSLSKLRKLKTFRLIIKDSKLIGKSIYDTIKILKICKKLENFEFESDFHSIEYIIYFFLAINEFKSLKRLSIRNTGSEKFVITSETFNNLKNLRHLEIDIYFNISKELMESIDTYFPKLQSIDCCFDDINEKIFKSLSKLRKLQTIYFIICDKDIENEFNESIIKGFMKSSRKIKSIKIVGKYNILHLRDENIFEFKSGNNFIIFKSNNENHK